MARRTEMRQRGPAFGESTHWLDLPAFDMHGDPNQHSGVVDLQPGLFFVGLPFLHTMASSMIHGVGRDAARIVAGIDAARGVQSGIVPGRC